MLCQFPPPRPPRRPLPWRSRRHPRGHRQGLPAVGLAGVRTAVGAGRARLPSVEETLPCGDGCQGRSFTPEAGGAAAAIPAHRELSLSSPPATSLHPARGRTEEKRGIVSPVAFRVGLGWLGLAGAGRAGRGGGVAREPRRVARQPGGWAWARAACGQEPSGCEACGPRSRASGVSLVFSQKH